MLAAGARVSHHLRECDSQFGFGLTSGLTSFPVVLFPPIWSRKPTSNFPSISRRSQPRGVSFFCSIIPSTSPGEIPVISDSFGSREDDREVSVAGGIVALGKFDALHVGHRELAIQASTVGSPFLLSFVGIAEVLGWEPRAPIVAQCDRKRVLSSWAPYCRNSAPSEYQIQFSSVRYLTPREFVEKLSKELGVRGVVAGESYRFGYKAAGDAAELVKLCEEYGLGAYIIKSVMDTNQKVVNSTNSMERGQVSSTRVRYALSIGDMKYVSELLGRRHRLILMAKGLEGLSNSNSNSRVSAPKSCLLNLAPKEGLYNKCFICTSDDDLIPCRVVIDSTHVHIEMDDIGTRHPVGTQNYLSVEFDHEGA
ncbi:FAD synthetase 2, chloroplastic-like [Cucurbita pepo subsp. pepo]|uniref:FAD synthetase 2, chloroplastic-like n=1 Tax=Cucurbita pepo subsp. pepo TaxID=3664 RepID=UPI000C9D38B7|nr:FAD synthetase 2, chloroplastic-like [Cucurbita pepo subsp. pepo]